MFPVRSLLKTPGFTLIALVTLALGIGVNTSMVSVVEALLFRTGPFPRPEEIVQLTGDNRQGEQQSFSAIEIDEIRQQSTSFASLTTIGPSYDVVVEADQPTRRLSGALVTADMFTTFGVPPIRGRAFTAEENQPGRNGVIVLSYDCWQSRYGGREDVIGHPLRISGQPVEIIGVMPASFDYPLLWQHVQFWRPVNFTKDQQEWRDYRSFQLIGRLAPGVTATQVESELAPLAATLAQAHPEFYAEFRFRARSLQQTLVDGLQRRITWLLLGFSGFVLLLACANLANLQLARAVASVRDLAIRAALGASRRRLILHQLGESLTLALAGGALGLLVALAINQAVRRYLLVAGRPGLDVTLDGSILGITLGVSVLTGVVFGLVPAWLASRFDLNAALKAQARGSTAGRGQHLLRCGLVVIEITLAFVLLGGAGLMHRGFTQFLQRDSGWDTSRVLIAQIGIPEERFNNPDRVRYFRRLETRLAELPGVEHAALATSVPVHGYNGARPVLLEGQTPADATRAPTAFHVMITSDYFATIGIDLLEGSLFPAEIPPNSPAVVILNESLARQLWPNESAVGRRLATIDSGIVFWYEVGGVVRDVDDAATLRPPETPFTIYKPLSQEPWSWIHLVVRSAAPAGLMEAVRRAAVDVDPELPADLVATVPQMIDESQDNLHLAGQTLTAFAAIGLLLAAVGVYGVVSNLVAQRTAEFGIRLALGAQPRDVHALVLREGIVLTSIGLFFGLAGALLVARFLGAWMPRLVRPDPLTLGLVAIALFLIAIVACLVPARRATKVDPLTALRAE